MVSASPSAPRRGRRRIRLERSPFASEVLLRGVVIGLLLAATGLAVGWPLTAASPTAADVAGLERVNVAGVDWLVTAARLTSQVGHLALVVTLAVLVAVWARWRWGTWDLGLLLLVVLTGSQAVTAVVKLLTSRDRPDDALVTTLSSAFPSGHAVRAAAVYGLVAWLVLLVVRRRAVRLVVASLAVVVIVASALARVALVAHWPTDVLAGVVIGTAWLVASLQLVRPRLERLPSAPGPDLDATSDDSSSGRRADSAVRGRTHAGGRG